MNLKDMIKDNLDKNGFCKIKIGLKGFKSKFLNLIISKTISILLKNNNCQIKIIITTVNIRLIKVKQRHVLK